MASRHILFRRTFSTAAFLVVTFACFAACANSLHPDVPPGPTADALIDQQSYAAFKTAVAAVPNRDFQVYWLRREFMAGGLEFQGAYFVPLGGVNTTDELNLEYAARLESGGIPLTLSLYSKSAWETAATTVHYPRTAQVTQRSISVAGRPAQLLIASTPGRPVNSLEAIIAFGDTTVLLVAPAVGPKAPGGPDANPLIDEQTFLNVLQNLRPYPQ